jgi:hypothetical protein
MHKTPKFRIPYAIIVGRFNDLKEICLSSPSRENSLKRSYIKFMARKRPEYNSADFEMIRKPYQKMNYKTYEKDIQKYNYFIKEVKYQNNSVLFIDILYL